MQTPFNKVHLAGDELRYLEDAVRSGQLSGDGPYSKRVEAKLESMIGCQKALLTHSCTAALEMAAILCDVGPGDEVIMPSYTFVSTANAVVLRGGVPVFVDVVPETLNMCPQRVAEAVTAKTKAIFVVHYAGAPAAMDEIMAIAQQHELLVVEDAAQALGANYRGRPCGSLGHLAAVSFHETKNLVSGEGGALLINTPELLERAEVIREKGTNRKQFLNGQVDKYTWTDIGSSFLPSELVAAFLLSQLEHCKAITDARLQLWDTYQSAFLAYQECGLGLPSVLDGCSHNAHLYRLILPSHADRQALMAYLKALSVAAPFHYVPLHSSPAGLRYGRVSGSMQVTDDLSGRLLRLPMYVGLAESGGVDTVVRGVRKFLDELFSS